MSFIPILKCSLIEVLLLLLFLILWLTTATCSLIVRGLYLPHLIDAPQWPVPAPTWSKCSVNANHWLYSFTQSLTEYSSCSYCGWVNPFHPSSPSQFPITIHDFLSYPSFSLQPFLCGPGSGLGHLLLGLLQYHSYCPPHHCDLSNTKFWTYHSPLNSSSALLSLQNENAWDNIKGPSGML